MTLFEYLAIAFGLLYSVAALRLVGGLPYAVTPARRYWVHFALTLLTLLGTAAGFWTFWSFREVAWTFPQFLLALTVPAFWYYCAAVLVPENPEDVVSWRDHYFGAHRRLYIGFGLWGLGAAVNLQMPFTHPARRIHAMAILLGTIGSMSANPRIHAWIVLAVCALFVGWTLTSGVLPGWLAR